MGYDMNTILSNEKITGEFKLGSTLKFNTKTEADIIEHLSELKSHRKLKVFIENCIRVACTHTEIGQEVCRLSDIAYHDYRKQYFNRLRKELLDNENAIKALKLEVLHLQAELKTKATLGLLDKVNDLNLQLISRDMYTQKLRTSLGAYYDSSIKITTNEVENLSSEIANNIVELLETIDITKVLDRGTMPIVQETIVREIVVGDNTSENNNTSKVAYVEDDNKEDEILADSEPVNVISASKNTGDVVDNNKSSGYNDFIDNVPKDLDIDALMDDFGL